MHPSFRAGFEKQAHTKIAQSLGIVRGPVLKGQASHIAQAVKAAKPPNIGKNVLAKPPSNVNPSAAKV